MHNPKRITQQLRSFERLLMAYDFKQPLARFLTQFFKENRQMGSNDRRILSRWLYNYFRLGNAFPGVTIVQRLVLAEYLCNQESELVMMQEPPVLQQTIAESLSTKIQVLTHDNGFELNSVFPLIDLVSPALAIPVFLKSLFRQPDLFIRIAPSYTTEVLRYFKEHQLLYEQLTATAVALPNGTNLKQYPELMGKFQVQDFSSQQTAIYFRARNGESWWDACAASGGKSLLLWQTYPGIKLLVSDIRNSILRNLDERFDQAGIKHYRRKIIDLTKNSSTILGDERFDGIIVDIPCSGSGTWGRTPEMMQQFDQQKLSGFVELQRRILRQVIHYLKPGAPLIYITCSVFAQENEQQVAYLESMGLHLEQMELLKGYEYRADTMFVARLVAAG